MNNRELVYRLAALLKGCDKAIDRMEYQILKRGGECVIVHYVSGAEMPIDITADSPLAVINEIVCALM